MPIGAAIGGIIGGGISAYGSLSASKTQAKAAREAQATMRPYTDVGKGAIYSLAELYGIPTEQNQNPGGAFNEASLERFRMSPEYSFAENEGRRQLMFGAARLGDLKSGNTGRDLVSFGQGLANTTFGNYFSRLMQLANLGQGGASNTASLQQAEGAARASGVVGAGNAINSAIGGTANNLLFYNLLNRNGNGSVYGGNNGAPAAVSTNNPTPPSTSLGAYPTSLYGNYTY